jgi:hypothetical protein
MQQSTQMIFNKDYAKLYNKALDQLEELIENKKNQHLLVQKFLGIMARLRHLAGLLKLKPLLLGLRNYWRIPKKNCSLDASQGYNDPS